MQRSV